MVANIGPDRDHEGALRHSLTDVKKKKNGRVTHPILDFLMDVRYTLPAVCFGERRWPCPRTAENHCRVLAFMDVKGMMSKELDQGHIKDPGQLYLKLVTL